MGELPVVGRPLLGDFCLIVAYDDDSGCVVGGDEDGGDGGRDDNGGGVNVKVGADRWWWR